MVEYDEKTVAALQKIRKYEEAVPENDFILGGWTWDQVAISQATINKLLTMDLVKRTFSSNRTKAHRLTDKAIAYLAEYNSTSEAAAELVSPVESSVMVEFGSSVSATLEHATKSMFDSIVGYQDLKELLRESILTEKPIHILLVSPPAMAKSLIIYDIERVLARDALWVVGSATSRAGLWDEIAERRPRVLLIDELDKMAATDTAALLSLMETGRLVRTKVRRKLDIKINVWVIATANRTYKMAPELLSRFKVYHISEYTATEFREVVTKALCIHEDMTSDSASEIALRLVNKTKDIRDAVRVARLSKRVGIQRAVELLVN